MQHLVATLRPLESFHLIFNSRTGNYFYDYRSLIECIFLEIFSLEVLIFNILQYNDLAPMLNINLYLVC